MFMTLVKTGILTAEVYSCSGVKIVIIVYASVLLVVAALIYLGVSANRVSKKMQPDYKDLADTSADLQGKIEKMNVEKIKLTNKIDSIKRDVDVNKAALQNVVSKSKESVSSIKGLWDSFRKLPNPRRRMPDTEIRSEVRELVNDVLELWKKVKLWKT
jgi:uncharacterized protein YoxC